MIDDGVIKFDCSGFIQSGPLENREFDELELWRSKLFQLNLIGEYKTEKVGFGNLSQRKDYSQFLIPADKKAQFIITGTQTGKYACLTGAHYTRILDYSFEKNSVIAMGEVNASSETLTHAALYELDSSINAVFHVHHKKLWKMMLEHGLPSTPAHVPYGTLEMAQAASDLFKNNSEGVFAMEGHEDGIIAFSPRLDQCGKLLLELFTRFDDI